MNRAYNYVTVDNPNIPVLLPSQVGSTPLGEFVEQTCASDQLDSSLGQVRFRDMYLPNFSIREFEGSFTRNALLVNQRASGIEFPGSCLFIQGNVKSMTSHSQRMVEAHNHSQNFKYDPNNEYRHLLPADEPFHYIHFSYTRDYFNQFLTENELWSDALRGKVQRRETILGDYYAPIRFAQERALENIFNCPLSGKMGQVMIETSIVQIVLLQLHSLFGDVENPLAQPMPKRDIEVTQELKDYLTKTFLEDHSLTNLARHFGTNTNKLMTMFRKFFNTSIFEYIAALRMEHAKELLREKDMRVAEVARVVGYRNANHFSTAFKRRFGITPSDVK